MALPAATGPFRWAAYHTPEPLRASVLCDGSPAIADRAIAVFVTGPALLSTAPPCVGNSASDGSGAAWSAVIRRSGSCAWSPAASSPSAPEGSSKVCTAGAPGRVPNTAGAPASRRGIAVYGSLHPAVLSIPCPIWGTAPTCRFPKRVDSGPLWTRTMPELCCWVQWCTAARILEQPPPVKHS